MNPQDIMVRNIDLIEKGAVTVEALDHLLHGKAFGPKQCKHRVGAVSDRYALSNSLIGALEYIAALFSEVGAKVVPVEKEEGAIPEILQVL